MPMGGRARGREGVTLHIYTIQTPDFLLLLLAITQLLPGTTSYTPTGDKATSSSIKVVTRHSRDRAGLGVKRVRRCTQSSPVPRNVL